MRTAGAANDRSGCRCGWSREGVARLRGERMKTYWDLHRIVCNWIAIGLVVRSAAVCWVLDLLGCCYFTVELHVALVFVDLFLLTFSWSAFYVVFFFLLNPVFPLLSAGSVTHNLEMHICTLIKLIPKPLETVTVSSFSISNWLWPN